MIRKHFLAAVVCAIALVLFPLRASAAELLVSRLPGGGNFLLSVDTAQFLKSPLALYQGWANTDPFKFPRTPNPLPETPGIQQLILTQEIDTRTGQPAWEAAVLQFDRPVDLPTAARHRAGYID